MWPTAAFMSYRVPRNADMWRAYADHIAIGSTVSIRTTRGERLTGVLFVVDDTAITVKPKTRLPEAAHQGDGVPLVHRRQGEQIASGEDHRRVGVVPEQHEAVAEVELGVKLPDLGLERTLPNGDEPGR